MFVIDDLLVLVLYPLVKRTGDRLIDTTADNIADGVVGTLNKLIITLRGAKDGPTAAAAIKTAAEALKEAGADPTLVERVLGDWSVAGVGDMSDAQRRLHAIWAFMAFSVDSAARLRRPVALPGFLTGPGWVVVIDSRFSDKDQEPYGPFAPDGKDHVDFIPALPNSMWRQRERAPDHGWGPWTDVPADIACHDHGFARIWFFEERAKPARTKQIRDMEKTFKSAVSRPAPRDLRTYMTDRVGDGPLYLLDMIDTEIVYPYTKNVGLRQADCAGGGGIGFDIELGELHGLANMRDGLYRALEEGYQDVKNLVDTITASSAASQRPQQP